MNHDHIQQAGSSPTNDILLALPFFAALGLYLFAVIINNQHYKKWPRYRSLLWILGLLIAASAIMGPVANRAHEDFTFHMIGHLFLGMLAPLLLALAAPVTLILRTLTKNKARSLSRFLKSRPISFYRNPIPASILNIGGLWMLYTTNLYTIMHDHIFLYILVHIHVFIAGYLYTISMIYIDPTPHRHSYLFRAIVFVTSLAGHGILSKFIYARPPAGVPSEQAEMGAMIMYYGGDAIDIILITLFCYQWYKAAAPRPAIQNGMQ